MKKTILTILDRTRQAKWDRRNLRTVSTHLTVGEAKTLHRICSEAGISRYHLLHWFLISIIRHPEAIRKISWLIRRDSF